MIKRGRQIQINHSVVLSCITVKSYLLGGGWEVIKNRDSLKHVNKVIANTPLGLLCLLHVFFQLAQSTADRKGTAIRLAKGLRIPKWAAFKTYKKCGTRAARGFAARLPWRLRRQHITPGTRILPATQASSPPNKSLSTGYKY